MFLGTIITGETASKALQVINLILVLSSFGYTSDDIIVSLAVRLTMVTRLSESKNIAQDIISFLKDILTCFFLLYFRLLWIDYDLGFLVEHISN